MQCSIADSPAEDPPAVPAAAAAVVRLAAREQAVRALWVVADLTEAERRSQRVRTEAHGGSGASELFPDEEGVARLLGERAADALIELLVDGSPGAQTAAAGVVLAAATRRTLSLWVATVVPLVTLIRRGRGELQREQAMLALNHLAALSEDPLGLEVRNCVNAWLKHDTSPPWPSTVNGQHRCG